MATLKEVIQGLTILAKYGTGEEMSVEGQHDVLMVEPSVTQEEVSAEDVKALDAMGWFWSKENDCWSKFT